MNRKCSVEWCDQKATYKVGDFGFCEPHYRKVCAKLNIKPDIRDKALIRRKARSTGTTVALYHAEDAYESDPDISWGLVCEDHGGCVYTKTRAEAESWP